MKFRTELQVKKYPFQLSHADSIYCAGSCFADKIGERLAENKFTVTSNPFGIVYHPVGLLDQLTRAMQGAEPDAVLYLRSERSFRHFHYHSSVAGTSEAKFREAVLQKQHSIQQFLKDANLVILTFGTAFVYIHKERGIIVNNCHKQPAGLFEKGLLTMTEMKEAFARFCSNLRQLNPDCKILVTVSPVRHVRDGIEENAVSKALLRLLIHEICNAESGIFYFPSYELVLDDLRDYRFYEQDLVHPNEQALAYIWEYFSAAFFDSQTVALVEKWRKIRNAINHRVQDELSDAYKAFLNGLIHKLEEMQEVINCETELDVVRGRLRSLDL